MPGSEVRGWKRWLRRAALGGLLVLIALQFVPAERSNPRVESDLVAPEDVETILRRSCYDCHSHETRWPWYSRVAPVSWWVASHVDEGRGDLNFSRWPTYDFEAQEDALDDIYEQVSRGEMPLYSYTLLHRDARLSDAERQTILDWARPR